VTVFGQSAGANSGALLLVSPLAKGLFHALVAESGGLVENSYPALGQAEESGKELAAKLHVGNLKELRRIPADDLLRASDRQLHPIVDDYVVPGDPYLLAADGKATKIPVLLGSNSNERGNYPNPHTVDEYAHFTATQFPGALEEAMEEFPAPSDAEAQREYLRRARDVMAMGMRNWAGLMQANGVPAYLYYFDRTPPARIGETALGAVHTAEIVYFRNDLDTVDRPWTAEDRKLAELMSAYLVNFAKNHDPNGPALPRWPVYERGKVMELGDHVGPITTPDGEQLDWLENYFVRQHRNVASKEASKNYK
jgi:para-nitrobenzyl esterase